MIEPTGLTEEKIYGCLDDWKDAKQIMRETKIPAASCRTYLEAMRKKGLVKREDIDGHEMWNRATSRPPIQNPPLTKSVETDRGKGKSAAVVKLIMQKGKPLTASAIADMLHANLDNVYVWLSTALRNKQIVGIKNQGEKTLYWLPEDKPESGTTDLIKGDLEVPKCSGKVIVPEPDPAKSIGNEIHIPEFIKKDVQERDYTEHPMYQGIVPKIKTDLTEEQLTSLNKALEEVAIDDALTGNNLDVTIEVEGKKFHAIGQDKIVLYMLDLFLSKLA